ncbi:MAG: TIGR00730 family Rossman fold protein [Pseudomonadota bacterium]
MRRLCVFCGSSKGVDPRRRETARALGAALAERGVGLVYGGASIGLMGAVADGALAAGGEVIGVLPRALFQHEVAHQRLTALHETNGMHERKAMMAELSDGFIALPGGLGTLEELFEVWTWAQLGVHAKPIGLLNDGDFYSPLLRFLDHVGEAGFLRPGHRELLLVESEIGPLLQRLEEAAPRGGRRRLTPDQT